MLFDDDKSQRKNKMKMNKEIAHQLITYIGWLKSGQLLDCGKSITLKRMVSHIEVRTGKKCEEVFEEMKNLTEKALKK